MQSALDWASRRFTASIASTAVAVLLGSGVPALAQPADPAPLFEVSGGYQFVDVEDSDNFQNGWYGDVAFNLNRIVGIVGQASVNSESEGGRFTEGSTEFVVDSSGRLELYLGGVRFSDRRSRRVAWFGHALVGVIRATFEGTVTAIEDGLPSSVEEFGATVDETALQFGGGVTVRLSGRVGLRVEADRVRVFAEDGNGDLFKFLAGVSIGIGQR